MSKLFEYRKRFAQLDGWFNEESQAIWDCLLCFQSNENIRGNLLEIGVWQGKSAALSTLHARQGEQCLFVDPFISDPVTKTLRAIHDACVFMHCNSDALNTPRFFID